MDTGYQILQSLYAIAGGGWAGVGFGNSRQKFLYLPYRETDFIFSIYAEEFGFLGCLALLALYWLLIWRCVLVTIRCPERFGRLLAGGITAMLCSAGHHQCCGCNRKYAADRAAAAVYQCGGEFTDHLPG